MQWYETGKSRIICADEIYENGIFLFKKKCSMIIGVGGALEGEVFCYLREREISFRFLKQRLETGYKSYLYLYGEEDPEKFKSLVNILIMEMEEKHFISEVCQLTMTERFRLMHQISLIGMEHQALNYSEYINSAEEWKKDVCDFKVS